MFIHAFLLAGLLAAPEAPQAAPATKADEVIAAAAVPVGPLLAGFANSDEQDKAEKPAESVPFTLNVGQLYDFLMPSGKLVFHRSIIVLEPPSKNWVKVQIDGSRVGWVNLNQVIAISPTVIFQKIEPGRMFFEPVKRQLPSKK